MSIQTDYEEATVNRLLVKMKEGKIPWRRPWNTSQAFDLPMNPTTGNAYHGMNTVVLLSEGYADPRWLTYKQAVANGWQVRKGQKSTQIGYFQRTEEKKDEQGNKVTVELDRPRFFKAFVFNAEQIEGMPPLPVREPVQWDSHERLDLLKSDLGVEVRHGGNQAYFSPFHDYVQMPNREQFPTLESYSSTLLHEVGHWTGHSSRLNRDQSGRFGTKDYAFEELVAEISSLMMGAEFEIPHDFTQHASYVQNWMELLKEDPKAIFKAASLAGKAKAFLLEHEKTWSPEMAKPREQVAVVASPIQVPVQAPVSQPELVMSSALPTHENTSQVPHTPIFPEFDRLRTKWVMDVFDGANDRDLVPEMLGIQRSIQGGFHKFTMGSTHLAYLSPGRFDQAELREALFNNLYDLDGTSDYIVWAANQKDPRVEALTLESRKAHQSAYTNYRAELKRVYGDKWEEMLPRRDHKEPDLKKATLAHQDASKAWIRDVNNAREGLLNAVMPKDWEARVADQVEALGWLKEQLKDAGVGVDANRSFHLLQDTALAEDVMPMARLRKADEHTPYERLDITYLRKDGVELPIRSVLPINGKALTYIGEERVPGTFPSSERESITNALRFAISDTKDRASKRTVEATPTPEPEKATEKQEVKQEQRAPHMLMASRDQELSYYPVLQKTIIALEELKPEERPHLLKEASRDVLMEYAQIRRGEHPSVALGSDRIAHAEFYESQFARWQPDFAKQVALEWGNNMRRYSEISGLSPDRVHATANSVFWEAERELKRRDRPIVPDEISEEWALRAEHLCTKTKVWSHQEDADCTRKLLTVAAAQLRAGDWNLAVENLKDAQAYEGLQDMEMKQNGMMALFDEVQNTWTRWQQQNGLGQVVTPRMKREFEAIPKNLAEITPEANQAIQEHVQQTRQARQSQEKTRTQSKTQTRGASR